ncbi:hypothetical protein [Armatimonas sp.]|uniref:hypothetical protein n=1 Tax=Armatimonas sp. TaxID=1872638 RepID=UPI0037528D45
MTWIEAREQFPNRWLIFEVIHGHLEAGQWRVDELSVLESKAAPSVFQRYSELQRTHPGRELGFFHTSQTTLALEEAPRPQVRPRT